MNTVLVYGKAGDLYSLLEREIHTCLPFGELTKSSLKEIFQGILEDQEWSGCSHHQIFVDGKLTAYVGNFEKGLFANVPRFPNATEKFEYVDGEVEEYPPPTGKA